jgi:hypothetical protein
MSPLSIGHTIYSPMISIAVFLRSFPNVTVIFIETNDHEILARNLKQIVLLYELSILKHKF